MIQSALIWCTIKDSTSEFPEWFEFDEPEFDVAEPESGDQMIIVEKELSYTITSARASRPIVSSVPFDQGREAQFNGWSEGDDRGMSHASAPSHNSENSENSDVPFENTHDAERRRE